MINLLICYHLPISFARYLNFDLLSRCTPPLCRRHPTVKGQSWWCTGVGMDHRAAYSREKHASMYALRASTAVWAGRSDEEDHGLFQREIVNQRWPRPNENESLQPFSSTFGICVHLLTYVAPRTLRTKFLELEKLFTQKVNTYWTRQNKRLRQNVHKVKAPTSLS
jgi:hypothetical protein